MRTQSRSIRRICLKRTLETFAAVRRSFLGSECEKVVNNVESGVKFDLGPNSKEWLFCIGRGVELAKENVDREGQLEKILKALLRKANPDVEVEVEVMLKALGKGGDCQILLWCIKERWPGMPAIVS